jgi:hypothetical protein
VRRGAFLALLFLLPSGAAAQEPDWTELQFRRQADGVRSLAVDIAYAAGTLEVGRAESGLLYDVDLRYDAGRLRPERSWDSEGAAGRLSVRLVPAEGDDTDWKLDGGQAGRLRLGLPGDASTNLTIEVGAAEARVRLGGIPLSGLIYRTGASESEISFDEPNPERMDEMELAAGAAEFRASGLGNARFGRLRFEGAVGDVTLDFRGSWSADAEAEVAMGLGAMKLILPSGIGVEIEKSGLLAGFDPAGMVRTGDAWRTANWEDARYRLRIRIRAAFGHIAVAFAD